MSGRSSPRHNQLHVEETRLHASHACPCSLRGNTENNTPLSPRLPPNPLPIINPPCLLHPTATGPRVLLGRDAATTMPKRHSPVFQGKRTASTHLAGEAQHELGIDPGPRAQQGHRGSDDQGHLPAGSEGDDICCNDGDQGLDDQAQLVPHRPPDVQSVGGQPGCNGPTGVLLLVEPAYFLHHNTPPAVTTDAPADCLLATPKVVQKNTPRATAAAAGFECLADCIA